MSTKHKSDLQSLAATGLFALVTALLTTWVLSILLVLADIDLHGWPAIAVILILALVNFLLILSRWVKVFGVILIASCIGACALLILAFIGKGIDAFHTSIRHGVLFISILAICIFVQIIWQRLKDR